MELEALGFKVFKGPSTQEEQAMRDFGISVQKAKAVVIAFDHEINYIKIAMAQRILTDPDCLFIATNDDHSYPGLDGFYPGTGTFVAAVKTCSEREPIVIGKPHGPMMDCIKELLGTDQRVCMIGDKLDTDILFGNNNGITSILVETGVHTESDVLKLKIEPSHCIAAFPCIYD